MPADGRRGKYVYCIIRTDSPPVFGADGIGGRGFPVHTVHFRELAAVVSNCPLIIFDATQENALTHERINELVMQEFTVLPMSFGTVFRTADDVRRFLESTYDALRDALARIEGKLELGLRVDWDKERITGELAAENEEIRRLKEEILSSTLTSTYYSRMQLGSAVESALHSKAEALCSEIYQGLRSAVVASRFHRTIGEKTIMNAAFLVDRRRLKMFDEHLARLGRKYEGTLSFVRSGPWPPYNFVNLRLKLEAPDPRP